MSKNRKLSPLEQKINTWFTKLFTRVPLMQKILFLDHLRIMIRGGLSLVESLHVLGKETSNKKMSALVSDVEKKIENGMQLSQALGHHTDIFPLMYIKMIEAGETGGQLDMALEQAVIQMRKAYELSSSVRGAMIYPSVIIVAMSGIGIMMVTVVLPQLTSLFKEFDAELPLATRLLIKISDVASKPIAVVLIISLLISFVVGFWLLLKRSPKFKSFIHSATLRLPIFGGIIKQINLARFSLTLSSLLKSAIPVVDATNITADTCSNMQYQKSLRSAAEVIKGGSPLSQSLQAYPKLFPPMVVEMVTVGEQSGEVEKLLTELANFYNDEVSKTMKNFTTIIEPVIIIVIGIAVAGMAMAVIMPMYTLVQNF